MLVCMDCHALSALPCPDCEGFGKRRETVQSAWDEIPVIQSVPCTSCSATGTVYCDSCLGIGGMRCSECRGLGHVKCDCTVTTGYVRERL